MDSWVLKQLRAFVLTDLKDFIPSGYFDNELEELRLSNSFSASKYLSFELHWGKLAAELGSKLYFQSPVGLTARQVSASELLMNLGMLAAAASMLSVTEQMSNKAALYNIPDGNSGNVASQINNDHIPIFHSNIYSALEQYLQHLTYKESKPYICLLSELKQNEIKSMNENTSKAIRNTINVSGSVSGNIQAGESNMQTKNKIIESPPRANFYKWLISNIGSIILGLLFTTLIAWLGLKYP